MAALGIRRLQSCAAAPLRSAPRRAVLARSGVQDLLNRDRRNVELTDAFEDAPAAPSTAPAAPSSSESAAVPSSSSASSSGGSGGGSSGAKPARRGGVKTRQQRQAALASAADAAPAAPSAPSPGYKRCKDAIDAGLACFASRDYDAAIAAFNAALELPGNGAYRLPGSPREYSCPSDAEEQACMYNLACCYAQLGQAAAALTCVESILEGGFKDVSALTSDADLAPIQGPQLTALINKYTGLGGLLLKLTGKKEEVLQSDDNKNKPWLLW